MKKRRRWESEDSCSHTATNMKQDLQETIAIPEKIQVAANGKVTVKGPKGEVSRVLKDPQVLIQVKDGAVVISSKKATKRERKKVYTYIAHIKNMFKGVTEGHYYELKICAAHFPMNVTVSGKELIIKNFLGENSPRVLHLEEGVSLKVNGDVIRIESPDVELAGRTASQIELITRVRNRDRRIFQDGIFIINKCGEVM